MGVAASRRMQKNYLRQSLLKRSFSGFLSTILNRCPGCGKSATTFCARCWYILNTDERGQFDKNLNVISSRPFVSRALYIWTDTEVARTRSDIIRSAILASKGRPNSEIYRLFAEEIFRRSVLEDLWRERRNWTFIVPPSVRYVARDHAYELASHLANLTGGILPLRPILSHVEQDSLSRLEQKLKSRKDRESKRFLISGGNSDAKSRLLKEPGFLFLDDVIATGATAQAAWSALGKPAAFEAWAIAWRGLPEGGVVDKQ